MNIITPNPGYKTTTPAFGSKHHPRHFSAMMNYIYKSINKNCCDSFERLDSIKVKTDIDGKEVSGIVNFLGGKYAGLNMDEGFEHLKSKFMATALDKYI